MVTEILLDSRYIVSENTSRMTSHPWYVVDTETLAIGTVEATRMPQSRSLRLAALDKEAAQLLFAIETVLAIRREDSPSGVTLWLRGDNLTDDDVAEISRIELDLFHKYPEFRIIIEIRDYYGRRPLRSEFWEHLTVVQQPASAYTAATS